MKVLSVQQPWASLIVNGIKKVENRSWKPKEMPGRILIHASKKCSMRTVGNEPIEWVQEIINHQIYGNLADFAELPDGAIIGYATVEAVDQDCANSVWASGENDVDGLYYWHIKDAFVFDEPILGVKGKLHLWEYDLDENNLPPAHQVNMALPEVTEENVMVPVNEAIWNGLKANSTIVLELGTLAQIISQPEVYDLKPLKTITFSHNGQQRTFELMPETEAQYITDGSEDQTPLKYLSLFEPEGAMRWIAYFVWGEEIKK